MHDVSASLRGMAPQRAAATVRSDEATGMAEEHEVVRTAAAGPAGAPDGGAAEQTHPGQRPPITPDITFDNGLDGGSTSDNNIGAGPDSIVVMRNSRFKVMSKTGDTLFGPVNNNSIFAGQNEVQQVALSGYTTDGTAYRLGYDGDASVPITRGQNDTQAGIQAAIMGGNEQQQIALTGFTGDASYTLGYDGAQSAPLVHGVNHTAAAIQAALNGTSEVQTVSLGSASSYRLTYAGQTTVPIVKGSNDTPAGIQNALQGGNEVQQVTFANFDATRDDLDHWHGSQRRHGADTPEDRWTQVMC